MSHNVQAKVVVFAGPSLPIADRPPYEDFIWRPPVQAGDMFGLCDAHPRAVLILDGFFDERPAVRHKEILSLISEGVPVLGASSMGALRAAELHEFGMIGVGHIFNAYATGRIEGDDDVALVHGFGFPAWRGGPMHAADAMGLGEVLKTVREMHAQSGSSTRIAHGRYCWISCWFVVKFHRGA